jgi:hypothetical protein
MGRNLRHPTGGHGVDGLAVGDGQNVDAVHHPGKRFCNDSLVHWITPSWRSMKNGNTIIPQPRAKW